MGLCNIPYIPWGVQAHQSDGCSILLTHGTTHGVPSTRDAHMGQPMECTAYGMHKMYHIQYILCDRPVDRTDAEEALQPDRTVSGHL